MKNSTLFILTSISSLLGILLYLYTYVMTVILTSCLVFFILYYIIMSAIDYNEWSVINQKNNLFFIISKFLKWLDDKPKLIKPSRKKWRAPNNWDKEI